MDAGLALVLMGVLVIAVVAVMMIYMTRKLALLEARMAQPAGTPDTQGLTLVQNELREMRKDMDSVSSSVRATSDAMCERIDTRMSRTQQLINTSMNDAQQRMSTALHQTQQNMTTAMGQTQTTLNAAMTKTGQTIEQINKELGKVVAAQDQIKSLDGSIKNIQNIFSSPKLRGGLGEFNLEMLLEDVLPGQWEPQYHFKDGTAVDAVIKIKDKLVPIDSKFPLDRYNAWVNAKDDAARTVARKDLDRAIEALLKDISIKYVKPEEDTLGFALMYVPSNKMFYEIFLHDEADTDAQGLYKYAFEMHVYPICPANLLMYLHAIGIGLKGMQVEENAQEIIQRLENVRKKFDNFKVEYEKVDDTIEKVKKQFDKSNDNFRKFDDEVGRILRLKTEEDDAFTVVSENVK